MALFPSAAILVGVYAGIAAAQDLPYSRALLCTLWCVATAAWWLRRERAATISALAAFAVAGAILGAAAARDALATGIRAVLDAEYRGFSIEDLGPPGFHAPVQTRARLVDDASRHEFGVVLRAHVESVSVDGRWQPAAGGVRVLVTGDAAANRAALWRRGRRFEAPVTFRRPARYLNDGVPDFERDLALGGLALNASVKSGLLVAVIARGSWFEEVAGGLRARVRAAIGRHVGTRDAIAGAIVTAILIGDRTALPDETRDRLQAAGTYHVIAISGGNIAILAAIMSVAAVGLGAGPRLGALAIIFGLFAYASIVTAGPSVWRATLTAIVYLAARLLDHRSPPWNAIAASAGMLACVSPLDARDVGFALTFGATAAILETAGRVRAGGAPISWIAASAAASLAVEVVLLPIGATAFSRATIAGVVLNLVAVPLMTVTQIAGLTVILLDWVGHLAGVAGLLAAVSARALVESARLVELLPWLAVRVPPPAPLVVALYYAALAGSVWLRRGRTAARIVLLVCITAIVLGVAAPSSWTTAPDGLRLTMFDVGQAEALLLQGPGGTALMIDSGGAGIDGAAFDIGGRVLAPALWARGLRRIDTLAITHADPDHIGGAVALVRDFVPRQVWQGITVPRHPSSDALTAAATRAGAAVEARLAGWLTHGRGVAIRVLHPPPADWERVRVRNDDSIVMEVRYADVAILLTGDIGVEVERTIEPALTPARIRVLKVGHHGSRTSTSQALVDAWRPHVALISCGRGNRFGHPAPEVVRRLEAAGARIYRTDLDGQITLDTNGRGVVVRTFLRREATKLGGR